MVVKQPLHLHDSWINITIRLGLPCVILVLTGEHHIEMNFGIFHIYLRPRIVRAGLNVAFIMLFQYMKRNPVIKFIFTTLYQRINFSMPNTIFGYFSQNLQILIYKFLKNIF